MGVLLLMNMLMRKMTLFMNMQLRKTRSAFQIISGLSMHLCVFVCLPKFKLPQGTVTKHHNLLLNYRIHCPGALLGDKTINIVRHIEREGRRERGRECFPPASSCMYQYTYRHSDGVFRPRVSNFVSYNTDQGSL